MNSWKFKLASKLLFIAVIQFIVALGAYPSNQPSQTLPVIDTHAHVWLTTQTESQAYIDRLVMAMERSNMEKIALGLNARHLNQRPPSVEVR